jgi:hypothetical protein
MSDTATGISFRCSLTCFSKLSSTTLCLSSNRSQNEMLNGKVIRLDGVIRMQQM